jgi:hypothetical protein
MDAWRYEFIFLWTLEDKFHIYARPCIIFHIINFINSLGIVLTVIFMAKYKTALLKTQEWQTNVKFGGVLLFFKTVACKLLTTRLTYHLHVDNFFDRDAKKSWATRSFCFRGIGNSKIHHFPLFLATIVIRF